jgi:signal transduction histidine kinase
VTWYRSLYWRIALGFIACLALLLAVQGVLFVWMMHAAGSAVPSQPPERLAQAVAVDVGQALDRDPTLDIPQYLRGEYGRDTQPFFVLLADGRAVEVGARFPDALKDEVRARLDQLKNVDPARLGRGGPFGRGPMFRPGERGGADGSRFAPGPRPRFDRGADDSGRPPFRSDDSRFFAPDRGPRGGPGAFRTGRPALIVANNRLAGLVLVPPQPPFTFLLTRYGPTLLTVASATLVMGGILAAFVIFGPTRRRLRAVEDAARRLGAGDLTARAPSAGNDEVAAVASAFNAMADDLTARTEALVAVDRARRQLLADVSHELNTPVTAVRGYVETLSMPELSLDEETRARYLRIVGDETARLERIIGDLLDLARLEGGGGSLMLEQVRVEDLFARVLARHERAAAAGAVLMRAQIEQGAEAIDADRTRMEQALQNLAANALRHAPAGSVLELRAWPLDDTVALSVADQGPGIPPEHLVRVFDRFYKVDESRVAAQSGNSGSGLGLSIVKAIVERHGATITVESRPGRTVFEIAGLRRTGRGAPLNES